MGWNMLFVDIFDDHGLRVLSYCKRFYDHSNRNNNLGSYFVVVPDKSHRKIGCGWKISIGNGVFNSIYDWGYEQNQIFRRSYYFCIFSKWVSPWYHLRCSQFWKSKSFTRKIAKMQLSQISKCLLYWWKTKSKIKTK